MSEPFYRYGPPRRVEGGIKARSSRGAIGESWWSQRFLAVLESLALGSRLSRGRSYARRGQVLALTIAPGKVTATVQGSRVDPYSVTIGLKALSETGWRTVEAALADQAIYGARLLAGEMPHEIEEVFAAAGTPLFPTQAGQLVMRCSCPDWQVPCKHLAATFYLLAEAFDDDPFLVLAWRGRAREDLLAALRGLGGDEPAADPLDVPDEPLAERLGDFFTPTVSLARLRQRPAAVTAPPELLLRALEPPAIKARHIPLVDLLRPAYRNLGSTVDDPDAAP
jgi:uncharacterized Zn finger protein